MSRRDPEMIDIDVSLPDGDAVVTVRITAWPTRATWGYSGGDPASPGEWDIGMVTLHYDGGSIERSSRCTERDIIDAAVAEWLAGDR